MAIDYCSQSFKRQQGLGLVEIMISLTLGLLILAGVLQMYATSSQNARTHEATSRIQENMRYALSRIQSDMMHSGNMGCFSFDSDFDSSPLEGNNTELVKNLLNITTGRYVWDQFISGSNDTGINNTDEITVRYVRPTVRLLATGVGVNSFTVDDTAIGYNSLRQYQVITVANCDISFVFMVTNDPTTSGGVIEYQAGVVSPTNEINEGQSNDPIKVAASGISSIEPISEYDTDGTPLYLFAGSSTGSFSYYIGDATDAATACSAANPEACSLYRDPSNSEPEELVQGVNDFQVDYGREVGANIRFGNASGGSVSDADRIVVSLTFNSINDAPTNTGSALITKDISQTITLANKLE